MGLSCEAGSFSPLLPQPLQVFSVSGLRLYFPTLELWVAWSVTWSTSCCLAGQLQLCLPHSTIRHLDGSASCSLAVSPLHPAACLRPPTGLGGCVFFNSLVVGLPYSSIFYQFWLFFVFKLFFWFCEEAQCVYLFLHLGRKSNFFVLCHPPETYLLPRSLHIPYSFLHATDNNK